MMRHISEEGFHDFFHHHPTAKVLDVGLPGDKPLAARGNNVYPIPWLSVDWKANSEFLAQVRRHVSPTDHVLVICHHGRFSAEAGAFLEESGYEHVYNLLRGHKPRADYQPQIHS